jgi:hypothetical protein
MKIQYTYATPMTIVYDEAYKFEFTGSLDEVVDVIKDAFSEYGFVTADVIDSDTGEILVTVDVE